MAEFVSVAKVTDIPAGSAQAFAVGGEFVAVVNCGGQFYAINNVCSHAYAEMAGGEVDQDDCTIECPLHGSIFDLATGRPRTLPATQAIATYAVQIVDGDIQVAV